MRAHEILLEAKLTFTKQDFDDAAEKSEFGVVYLTMTGDGSLHIGEKWHARGDKTDPEYHPDSSWRRSIKITLVPKKKEIQFRQGSVGETLKPKVQQALRSLRDAGIIDSTWTIRTASEASGYVDGKFTSFKNEIDKKTLDELVDKAIRLSPITKDIVLYHGTSSIDWEKIQKVGLHPLGYGTNKEGGTESRAKHEGNTKVLYLAGSEQKAMDYAKSRVDDQNKKRHGSPFIYTKDNEPIVLAVRVPDPNKLVADDDLVNGVARNIARKIWKAKPEDEKKRIIADLIEKQQTPKASLSVFGYDNDSSKWDIAEMLWRETEEGFSEIMAELPKSLFKAWKASLTRENQVGYKGIIPPKFIRRVL